jgi:hypothetical protein
MKNVYDMFKIFHIFIGALVLLMIAFVEVLLVAIIFMCFNILLINHHHWFIFTFGVTMGLAVQVFLDIDKTVFNHTTRLYDNG